MHSVFYSMNFYNNAQLDPTSANFGLVSSQNNLPRNIQLGTKVIF